MARSGVIRDTATSLHCLLQGRVRSASGRPVRIHTGPPDRSEIGRSLPCLSLYLYGIEENRDLYRPERLLERRPDSGGEGEAIYRHPPIYLNMRHAIFSWGRTPVEEKHLLGEVLAVLMDVPHLEGGRGLLGKAFGPGDRVTLRLTHPFGIAEQQEVLRSLGVPLRPVLSCSATARFDSGRLESVRRVRRRVAHLEEKR